MAKTVIGIFDNEDQAARTIDNLTEAGVDRDDIKLLQGDADADTIKKEGRPGMLEKIKGFLSDAGLLKTNLGVSESDARWYEGQLRNGKLLLVATCDDDMAGAVQSAMQGGYGSQGISSAAPNKPTSKVPVVREDVDIGKQQVETGSVRLYARPVSHEVKENVTLREQHARVERHPVDRPATEADFAPQGTSMQMTETSEVPTITKQARVIEEVTLDSDVTENVQSVTATARGTEVEVERTGGRSRSYKDLDAEFRTGFQSTYGNTGADYESYAPAYRYGYDLATHKRYMQHDDWSALEAEAKPTWEQRNPGTWERYKDAIRQAWHRTRTSGQELKSGKPARSSKPA